MIKSIRLVNFKNFADETLRVGPFTVIVGANASGKSNIRDAFRFLHGIGRGYTLAEIIGGKYGADWKPIRGAANEIVRFGQAAFSIEVRMELEDADACYLIEVSNDKERPNEFRFTKEELTGVFKPDIFANMRFLELSPDQMREPAFPGAIVLGDSGENLPVLLEDICSDPKRKEILADWLSELTPMDVADFDLLTDLIERQTAKHGIQVLTTTHAPTLLTVMNDNTFEKTSVVCRLEDTSEAIIRPVAELPNVRELRQDQGLGRLHESGWMEDALFFTEDYDEAEDDS